MNLAVDTLEHRMVDRLAAVTSGTPVAVLAERVGLTERGWRDRLAHRKHLSVAQVVMAAELVGARAEDLFADDLLPLLVDRGRIVGAEVAR